MKLDIPLITGGKDSLCGSASVEMVLRYYGVPIMKDRVMAMLQEAHGGTDMPQIGRIFLHHGFDVAWVTLHPHLFKCDDMTLTQEEIQKKIAISVEFESGRKHDQITLDNLLAFMREGGTVQVHTPSATIVEEEIEHGRPVIAFFATSFSAGGRSNMNYHPVVIMGYRGDNIFVHDPQVGKEQKIPAEWFFNGIYASHHEILDDGSLLLITPRN